MTRLRRGGWWLVGLIVCFSLTWKIQQPLPAAAPNIPEPSGSIKNATATAHPDGVALVGAASCGAIECHGGNGAAGSKGSEYTTWLRFDPHASAHLVLYEERSRSIARNLHLDQPAHQAQICLDCHATKSAHGSVIDDNVSFGVSCESCHGPANEWIGPHTTLSWQKSGWKGEGEASKLAHGMVNTRRLSTRAKTCTQCHIGAADRDMNHDLIAAGHPRLNFEFAAFQASLPKHWREHRSPADTHPMDRDIYPDFEARSWAVGRVVSAQAALELLAARAEPASGKPWPEFSEYDCFACHHDLQFPSWRQTLGFPGRKPGTLPWGTWDLSLLENASQPVLAPGQPASWEAGMQELKDLMATTQSYQPASRARIAMMARDVARQLATFVSQIESMPPSDAATAKAWLAMMAASTDASIDWDHAAQVTLALQAMAQTWKDLDPELKTTELAISLDSLFDQLRFMDEPKNSWDSPSDFRPANFDAELKKFHEWLEK